eukprot:Tbor_TRINITY_DN4380_c0_g1::TRINITY_DN4380_c0_g1_i1::g.7746::m.7746/K03083/GSK3B; glycogen synthase kinase 3 beta
MNSKIGATSLNISDRSIDHSHNTNMRDRQSINSSTQTTYVAQEVIGCGSFGVVFLARSLASGELVAIKKTLQDKRFRNRELQLLRYIHHPNIIDVKHTFYSSDNTADELYLNIVMEFLPDTVFRFYTMFERHNESIPSIYVKLIIYQLLRACAYLHSPQVNICHRDIKPQNLLIDPMSGIMKLCDFGSAKQLLNSEDNISYICSRYYRAPELLLGCKRYSTAVDLWSVGCVLGELLLGQPLFAGETTVDQMVEIIKVIGTPSESDMEAMNRDYTEFRFPQIPSQSWNHIFRSRYISSEAIDVLSLLLRYSPSRRITALEAMCHPFFDVLKTVNTLLPNGKPLPSSLFYFTDAEIGYIPSSLFNKLCPHRN